MSAEAPGAERTGYNPEERVHDPTPEERFLTFASGIIYKLGKEKKPIPDFAPFTFTVDSIEGQGQLVTLTKFDGSRPMVDGKRIEPSVVSAMRFNSEINGVLITGEGGTEMLEEFLTLVEPEKE